MEFKGSGRSKAKSGYELSQTFMVTDQQVHAQSHGNNHEHRFHPACSPANDKGRSKIGSYDLTGAKEHVAMDS